MMQRALLLGMLALSMPVSAFDLDQLKGRLNELEQQPATTSAAPAAKPSGLAQFSAQEQTTSLKQALTQGAETAVTNLAKENGYLGNDKVRIPLPDNLQRADHTMRRLGLGKYPDELITSMNRAAEAAVPEARTLLLAAVKNMTVTDAREILLGNDDAATQYFRRNTETALGTRFKPIVTQSMQNVGLARTYDRFAGKGAQLGLVSQQDANLEDYITRKALDGLFLMMAEQEKEIRAHPLQAAGDLARKVFSALRGQ
ncbi:hypothetical protein MIZ01_2235 [Sideroxyarcus emersonii]|uniref:DUF4197 domain-containing protein n=1 Tax=Sideroxyarcus emersonii TaxID=2764705 RepID=A0AAN2BZU5_9PROT|nr:DUF4197 domain-containing protein [Sideroxyarcus emersonii]BCK88431.1 hypothetical protein MIZ01_2235 [Sideroxyarcus emersonii]